MPRTVFMSCDSNYKAILYPQSKSRLPSYRGTKHCLKDVPRQADRRNKLNSPRIQSRCTYQPHSIPLLLENKRWDRDGIRAWRNAYDSSHLPLCTIPSGIKTRPSHHYIPRRQLFFTPLQQFCFQSLIWGPTLNHGADKAKTAKHTTRLPMLYSVTQYRLYQGVLNVFTEI